MLDRVELTTVSVLCERSLGIRPLIEHSKVVNFARIHVYMIFFAEMADNK